MSRSLWGAIGVAATFTFLAAGCATNTPQPLHQPGESVTVQWEETQTQPPPEIWENGSGFISTDNVTEVFLGGSGSCPPVIKTAMASDEGDHTSLVIDLEPYPANTACTDDLVFYSFLFQTPSSSVTFTDTNTDQELKLQQFN